MKLGSLFDGSGGFPLAGSLCGITPIWASEIEPYPIAVTTSRFPYMKHIGDVSKVSGAEVEPVDVLTFGSPCQDLSIAGKRAGLKHEANGDDETTRSGLFMEAVRIIKEMRQATNGLYPTFALWENVPGAFSSNGGDDFRVVLEELIKIVEPGVTVPAAGKNGWPYADAYVGDGWSIAYRTLDAQYWGVPQRRRRIYLVADFRGERAPEILFEREGLRGYFEKGRTPWKGITAYAQGSTGADDREGEGNESSIVAYSFDSLASNSMKSSSPHSGCRQVDKAKTLDCFDPNPSKNQGGIAIVECYDARGNGDHENRVTDHTNVICLQGNGIDRADTAGCNGKGWTEDVSYTLNTIDRPAVAFATADPTYTMTTDGYVDVAADKAFTLLGRGYKDQSVVCAPPYYIVRRLTPTECARLQGFPSIVEVNMKDMTRDELCVIALASGFIRVDIETGKIYATRGPGGTDRQTPIELKGSTVNGYTVYSLHAAGVKKQIRAQRLVWIAAHGLIPDGMIVDHINNDKTDNRLVNLQLLTPAENSTKAKEDGRYLDGENHPNMRIKEREKQALYLLYWNTNKPYSYFAKMYGMSDSRAQQIIHEKQWATPDHKDNLTDDEYRFWQDVRNTYATINGRQAREYTRDQILTWYNSLHTDSSEYKMWGNGIALPTALYVMQGIAEKLQQQTHHNLNAVYRAGDPGPGGAHHDYYIYPADCDPETTELPMAVIEFQKGPRKDPEARQGVLDCDLLEIVRDRLLEFEAGPMACWENKMALRCIETALMLMCKRVEDRAERQVLGTMDK